MRSWDTFNRARAQRTAREPTRIWQRIYDTLDSSHIEYEKPGEYSSNGRTFFCPAIVHLGEKIAVIEARGSGPKGGEDDSMRLSTVRRRVALKELNMPYLMGRNLWDKTTWEIMIRRFLLRLRDEDCPQVEGVMPKYQSAHRKRRHIIHGK